MPEPDQPPPLSHRARVRRLTDAVDRDAVAAAVVRALRLSREVDTPEAPQEPRVGNPRWNAVTPVVRDHVRMFTRMLLSGTEPSRSDLRALALRAAAASQSPVEELLRSYRIGAEAACRAVRSAAGPEDLAAVVTVTEEMMAFVNLMTAAVVQASLDDRDLRRSERERRFRRLFDAIDGAAALTPDLVELAEDIGLSTTGPYLPFAAARRGAGAAEHARLAAELSAAGGMLAFSEGERIDGICGTASQLDRLAETEGVAVAIGVGASRGRLAAACRDLHVVIDVAVRRGRTGPIGLADFAPEVLVELCPEVSDALTARIYDPLPAELQATLHALVAFGFDRTTTAATLHIHRNTLLYRLGRIEERLGLDLSRAADQVSIYLATLRRDRVRGSQPASIAARRAGAVPENRVPRDRLTTRLAVGAGLSARPESVRTARADP
ncbi:PucR family transcriptional regulator [Cryptosporangium minutisporangium]|uniref:PucR family transcriptional regulator n=1 Tax=Cryptosporangium minutisporangium TaxID=113569 RepID=A0ABP6TDM3_9ACTN